MSCLALGAGHTGIFGWDDDDDERAGRILTDEEFARAFAARPGIFAVDRDRRAQYLESAMIVTAAGLGVLLTRGVATEPPGPDYYCKEPLPVAQPTVQVSPEPVEMPRVRERPTVIDKPHSGQRTLLARRNARGDARGGTGGGDPHARMTKLGLLGRVGDVVRATGAAVGDPLGLGGHVTGIDIILAGIQGMQRGTSGIGRRGAAGIGVGEGAGSGIGGGSSGLDGMLEDYLDAPTIDLKPRVAEINCREIFRPGTGVIDGGRSKSSIWRTVQQFVAGLRYAYNRRVHEVPGLAGRVTVRFAIDEYGNVLACSVVDSNMGDAVFPDRVVSIIKRWKFDRIDRPGDVTEVVYPFVFSL